MYLTRHRSAKGFTLIEVMVALVVVGMALPALLFRFQTMLDQTSRIEEKNYAVWIAQNIYKETILKTQTTKRVEKGKTSDKIEFGGIPFEWQMEIKERENIGTFDIEIKVGRQKDNWLTTLSGFLSV